MHSHKEAWARGGADARVHPEAPQQARQVSHVAVHLPRSFGRRMFDCFGLHVKAALGVLYLGVTLFSSTRFLITSASSMSNDFFWAEFNATVGAVFVADAFAFLANGFHGAAHAVTLSDPLFAKTPRAIIEFPPTISRLVQYHHLTTIEHGIAGLRSTRGADAPWVFTHFCWVDFDRRWSVAHTAKRAERCLASHTTNGAAYMESMLRNVEWSDFIGSWEREFTAGIVNPLAESEDGRLFIANLSTQAMLSPAEEAAHWRRKGITSYQLQFNNLGQIGLSASLDVVNAFAMRSQLTVMKLDYVDRYAMQTTNKMYWSPGNDFWALVDNNTVITGMSLVRNSTNFYENHGITMERVHMNDGQLPWPLTRQDALLREALGPFGSIDMLWTAAPDKLYDLIEAITTIINRIIIADDDAQATFLDTIPDNTWIYYNPMTWNAEKWSFMGGNLLCSRAPTVSYATQQFKFSDTCGSPVADGGGVMPHGLVGAFLSMGDRVTSDTIERVCTSGTLNVETCVSSITTAHKFATQYLTDDDRALIRSLVHDVEKEVQQLNVSIMQFATRTRVDNTTEDRLLVQELLIGDDWDLFGWLYLFDWGAGKREVVSFQGDNGTLTLMSGFSSIAVMEFNDGDVVESMSYYFCLGVRYVTLMLVVVAILVLIYAVSSRGHIAGRNLFSFNRIVGAVWVGRPLLLLRGIVAICILSTGTLATRQRQAIRYMEELPDPWFNSIITAGEATWLTYATNDVLLLVSQGYTHWYAPVTSLVVWSAVAMLQLVKPIRHGAVSNFQCYFVIPDTQVDCSAGEVRIGSPQRMLVIIAITISSVIVCFIVTRSVCKERTLRGGCTLLLPGIAQDMFTSYEWEHENEWYLDPASASIAGLVVIRFWRFARVLDIKTWSFLHLRGSRLWEGRASGDEQQDTSVTTTPLPRHLRYAICLSPPIKAKHR